MKILISDHKKVQDCVVWLKEHIGPVLPHSGGNLVRGEGWAYWINNSTITVELTDDVDSETAMIFMLMWS